MFNLLTKTGLNDVPEELFDIETVVDGLEHNDNKIETSERIENDKNSSKAHCEVVDKNDPNQAVAW